MGLFMLMQEGLATNCHRYFKFGKYWFLSACPHTQSEEIFQDKGHLGNLNFQPDTSLLLSVCNLPKITGWC